MRDLEAPPEARLLEMTRPARFSQPREDRTGDQHDAFSIATWLSRTDRDGRLKSFFNPILVPMSGRRLRSKGGYWVQPAHRTRSRISPKRILGSTPCAILQGEQQSPASGHHDGERSPP